MEVAKGRDWGDIRYGTMFVGKVYEGSDASGYSEVVTWGTVIRHTNAEDI